MILNQQNNKPSSIKSGIFLNNNISIETDSYRSSVNNNNNNNKNDKSLNSVSIETSSQQFAIKNNNLDKKIMTKNEIDELRNSVKN